LRPGIRLATGATHHRATFSGLRATLATALWAFARHRAARPFALTPLASDVPGGISSLGTPLGLSGAFALRRLASTASNPGHTLALAAATRATLGHPAPGPFALAAFAFPADITGGISSLGSTLALACSGAFTLRRLASPASNTGARTFAALAHAATFPTTLTLTALALPHARTTAFGTTLSLSLTALSLAHAATFCTPLAAVGLHLVNGGGQGLAANALVGECAHVAADASGALLNSMGAVLHATRHAAILFRSGRGLQLAAI